MVDVTIKHKIVRHPHYHSLSADRELCYDSKCVGKETQVVTTVEVRNAAR